MLAPVSISGGLGPPTPEIAVLPRFLRLGLGHSDYFTPSCTFRLQPLPYVAIVRPSATGDTMAYHNEMTQTGNGRILSLEFDTPLSHDGEHIRGMVCYTSSPNGTNNCNTSTLFLYDVPNTVPADFARDLPRADYVHREGGNVFRDYVLDGGGITTAYYGSTSGACLVTYDTNDDDSPSRSHMVIY